MNAPPKSKENHMQHAARAALSIHHSQQDCKNAYNAISTKTECIQNKSKKFREKSEIILNKLLNDKKHSQTSQESCSCSIARLQFIESLKTLQSESNKMLEFKAKTIKAAERYEHHLAVVQQCFEHREHRKNFTKTKDLVEKNMFNEVEHLLTVRKLLQGFVIETDAFISNGQKMLHNFESHSHANQQQTNAASFNRKYNQTQLQCELLQTCRNVCLDKIKEFHLLFTNCWNNTNNLFHQHIDEFDAFKKMYANTLDEL